LDKYTQSLYCPTANLVVPYKEDEAALDDRSNENPDVTLEMDGMGNQYLHLILPADRINFLNGLNNNTSETFFNLNSEESDDCFDGSGCGNDNS